MPPEVVAEYLKLGVLGTTIVALLFAVVWLVKENRRLQEDRIKYVDMRVTDQKEHAAENLRAAAAIAEVTQQSAAREEATKARWDAIEKINEGLQAIAITLGQIMERQGHVMASLDARQRSPRQ
jgi:hypothetical protein